MNEVNEILKTTPKECNNCDYYPPARIGEDGELYYPHIPGGLCDECRDWVDLYAKFAPMKGA